MTKVSTDPIADMLSRIRNAMAVRKTTITLPHSNIKQEVARIMKETNFIDGYSVEGQTVGKVLTVEINNPETPARITELKRISTPGRRMYVNADNIPTVKRGRGIVIVSTSKGLMTGSNAKKERLGGELIAEIY